MAPIFVHIFVFTLLWGQNVLLAEILMLDLHLVI